MKHVPDTFSSPSTIDPPVTVNQLSPLQARVHNHLPLVSSLGLWKPIPCFQRKGSVLQKERATRKERATNAKA